MALLDYIAAMERALGKEAKLEMKPMQPGDVKSTYADTTALRAAVGFAPSTPLETGLARFAEWFKAYSSSSMAAITWRTVTRRMHTGSPHSSTPRQH